MARRIRQLGRALVYLLPLTLLAFFLLYPKRQAQAAPYTNPYWVVTSPSPECPCSTACCQKPREFSPEHVSVRTGELAWDHQLFTMPGLVDSVSWGFRWRSMISGSTEFGNGMVPSFMRTLQVVNSTTVDIRVETGQIWRFVLSNGVWTPSTCGVYDTLAQIGGTVLRPKKTLSGGSVAWVLTDKWGNLWQFNSTGQPLAQIDRNGNTRSFTVNAAWQLTSFTDERGQTYTMQHNARGYCTSISDSCSRTWNLAYDQQDNLQTITTPGTADQPAGITTTFVWDAQNRLTGVIDGRGNQVWNYGYVGTSGQVSTVTIDGHPVSYAYFGGANPRTERTDRNGTIHRYWWSGTNVTQTDLFIGGQAKYVKLYRYSGSLLVNRVLPRGNRIDFVYDSMANLTQRRRRTADTSTNDPSDIVENWTYNTGNFATSYTDPLNNTTIYGRDSVGNLTSVTYPTVTNPVTQNASTSYTYVTGTGQLATATDEEGLLTTYVYYTTGTSTGLLQKVQVGPPGAVLETSYTYDGCGNRVSETRPNGQVWSYTYDALRRMTQKQAPSPLAYRTQYHLDGNGNVVEVDVENRDKDGNLVAANPWFTTTYTYTNTDDVSTITEEIDATTTRTTSFQYDPEQERIRVVKPELNQDRWDYDERGLVVAHVRGEGDSLASTTSYGYDDNGNLISETSGRQKTTTHTFDLFDRRTRTTNALGNYTEWTYDQSSRVTEVAKKDGAGNLLQRSTRYYDERGRLWKTSDYRDDPTQTVFSDAVTVIERLMTGQIHTVTDPLGHVTTTDYDAYHRVDTVQDPVGNSRTNGYDSDGNVTSWSLSETDGTNTVTHSYQATYDVLDRRLTTVEVDRTNPSNTYTTTEGYDSRSNRVWEVNAEGNPTRWTYDGLGRLIKREKALQTGGTIEDFTQAEVTQWAFDKNNRLTSHVDDASNTSSWAYDALDRPTSMTYPDNSSATYVHDLDDNVTQVTDPSGNVIQDSFDDVERNTSRTVTRASGFAGTTAETRTYDALDRMLTDADDDYKVTMQYAVVGFRSLPYTETQEYVGQTPQAKTVSTTFDEAGRKTAEGYPSGMALAYGYNADDQLTSIGDGTNTIVSYGYLGARPLSATYQNGATEQESYGGFREDLTSVLHQTSGGGTIVQLDYGYNKVHDRLYERYGPSGSSGDAFSYDKIRRLVTAWMGSSNPVTPSGNSYVQKIDYNMDDDGNRSSVVVTPWGGQAGSTAYTTNTLYQYTAVGGTSRTHDLNGNLTDDGTYLFIYDYKNQIVEVKLKSTGATVVEYRYDALGRRVEKAVVGGITERYIYSGVETVETFDGSNNWKQDFVFAQGIDHVVAMDQADILDYDNDQDTNEVTRSFYHRNALGSVMEITDLNQATVVSYRYNPYGAITITRNGQTLSSDPLGQHWSYTARFYDEETGLYYYRARYYSPQTGRFLERDALVYAPGACVYEYCRSRPIEYTDPLGLTPLKKTPLQVALDKMKDCPKSAPSPGACKVCCEKAAHDAAEAADRGLQSGIRGCLAKYPAAALALDTAHMKGLGSELMHGIHIFSTIAGAVTLVGGIGGAVAAEDAVGAATEAVSSALEHASDPVEGGEAAVDATNAIVKAWLTAAGKQMDDLLRCMARDGSKYTERTDEIHAALDDCLDKCRRRWSGFRYEFPTDDASWRWTSGRAHAKCPVHLHGDESGQDPYSGY